MEWKLRPGATQARLTGLFSLSFDRDWPFYGNILRITWGDGRAMITSGIHAVQ